MDQVGLDRMQCLTRAKTRRNRKADFAVSRAGDSFETVGRDDVDIEIAGDQTVGGFRQGADNAVDLRYPCVCGDCNLHRASAAALAVALLR